MRSAVEAQEILFALVERGEEKIDLPLTWAALTASIKGSIDMEQSMSILEEMKGLAKDRLAPFETAPVEERLKRLNDLFVNVLGFHGNTKDYNDAANSYLDDVLSRRRGIPITLSIVFMELGKAAGIEIDPIAFPGHFLVKERTKNLVCDPFTGRVNLSKADSLTIISKVFGREVVWSDEYMTVSTKRNIILRMLTNLRNSFLAQGDMIRMATTQQLTERLELLDDFPAGCSLH